MARPPKIPYEKMCEMKFGRLRPIENIGYVDGRTTWICQCDCGNTIKVTQKSLTTGNTKSCGCLQLEHSQKLNKTHGKSKTRIYTVYSGILHRCNNPNSTVFQYYGGKGVKMCPEWENDFLAFEKWMLENGYDKTLPRGMQTIDRIDANGDYCPENCRLISIAEQQRHKENNILYEYNGEEHLLSEWSEILGIDYLLLKSRVQDYGWTLKEAIDNPIYSKIKMDKITITFNGKTQTIKEWANELGISPNTIRGRLRYYSDVEKILNVEKNRKCKKADK